MPILLHLGGMITSNLEKKKLVTLFMSRDEGND